jgi:hypothetical protein
MAFVFDGIVYNFSQSIATSEALNKYQFLVRNGLAKLKRMLLYRTLNNWDELNSGHPCSKFKLTDNKNN